VLGAINAVSRELIAVTNTTVVNTQTQCELLYKIAAQGLVGPVTLVLDNARYQHNQAVKGLAASLGIDLWFLPGSSPNLNLIERLWRFIKREALYGRYHANFADFKAAIEEVIVQMPTKHKDRLASLLSLKFQVFGNVSLLAV
jgi:transposase